MTFLNNFTTKFGGLWSLSLLKINTINPDFEHESGKAVIKLSPTASPIDQKISIK
jgi:hypothetical protein